MTDPTRQAEIRTLLDAICKDSLECSLDRLLAHRHEDDGATSALFFDLSDALDAQAAALLRAEQALQRLANPMGEPKSEEAVLLQMEVQQIAMNALDARAVSGSASGQTKERTPQAVYAAMVAYLEANAWEREEPGSGWWLCAERRRDETEATIGEAVESQLHHDGIDTRESPVPVSDVAASGQTKERTGDVSA